MDVASILGRVKGGRGLSPFELSAVREAIRGGSEDLYTLLHILWKAGDVGSEPVFYRQLSAGDEMVRRISLQALADRFPSVRAFEAALLAVDDVSIQVRLAAWTSLGDIGRTLPHLRARAAARLLEGLEALVSGHPEQLEWEAVYEGLLNLLDVPLRDRPNAARALDPSTIDPRVIEQARTLSQTS